MPKTRRRAYADTGRLETDANLAPSPEQRIRTQMTIAVDAERALRAVEVRRLINHYPPCELDDSPIAEVLRLAQALAFRADPTRGSPVEDTARVESGHGRLTSVEAAADWHAWRRTDGTVARRSDRATEQMRAFGRDLERLVLRYQRQIPSPQDPPRMKLRCRSNGCGLVDKAQRHDSHWCGEHREGGCGGPLTPIPDR
jgi:hypothetical protein